MTDQVENEWNKLAPILKEIITCSKSGQTKLPIPLYSKAHSTIYNISLRGFSFVDQVYKSILLDEYLKEDMYAGLKNLGNQELMKELLQSWNQFQLIIRWFGSVFAYLDKEYIPLHNLTSVKDSAKTSFKWIVFNPLLDKMRDYLLSLLSNFRFESADTESEKLQIFKDGVKMIVDIGGKNSYDTNFEMPLIQMSISFYRDAKLRYYGTENYDSQVKLLWKKEEPLLKQLEISNEVILKLKEQFVLILGISNIES